MRAAGSGEQAPFAERVAPYLHPSDGRRPESLRQQRRVLRRWERDAGRIRGRTLEGPEETAQRQLERIRALVETAYATHPLYHRLYRDAGFRSGDLVTWADYHALPTVDKRTLIDGMEEFLASRALPPEDVYVSRTSGSSGEVLHIHQDEETSDNGQLFYMRHYEQMLGRHRLPSEWVYEVYLAPHRYPSLDGSYPVFTLSQDCPEELAAAHMRQVRPAVLAGFPSYFLRLVEKVPDLDRIGVEAICTNSESSTPEERRRISAAFDAPIFDEYSSEELYLIATQCSHGRYHLVEDNVRVDTMASDARSVGEIVATSLVNNYMPFIRYRQGDVVSLSSGEERCECGNCFRTLRNFHGRADQTLVRPDGSAVPPDQVMGVYDRTLLTAAANVAEFQIVQEADGAVRAKIRPRPGGEPGAAEVEAFRAGIREVLGSERVLIELCATIPTEGSHKRRIIVSHRSGGGR